MTRDLTPATEESMSDVEDASWADGDIEEEANDEYLELVDLSKIRDKYQEFIEAGELEHALSLLDQFARWPDSTRYLDDNLWLYQRIGDLNRALEREDLAIEAYARAFELDPRELAVLQPYSELLFHHGLNEEGIKVVQALLLHHKRSLPTRELVTIYRQMGSFYEGLDDGERARTAFEKALEQDPGDTQSLAGLLRVVGEVGEPLDVVRVRQKLIRSLDDPRARSHALVALGDDWVYAFNDPGRALDVYEQAVIEFRENATAIERLARVGSEVGDWRRVSRAYFTLSQLADTPEDEADWVIRAAVVARDELWEADKALAGFRKALDLDPTRLDAFKAVTSILVDAKDWEELESAYVKLITANVDAGNEDPKLMGVLWRNLGDLYKKHLSREGDAIFAYQQAAAYLPQAYALHESVVELAESSGSHLDTALEHLQAMRRIQPDNHEVLDRIGRVHLRQKNVDRAWCTFRALAYRGASLDEKAQSFVERLDTALFRPVTRQISPPAFRQYIFSEQLDGGLTDVFRCLKPGLEEWVGESTSKYGLKRRDRLKLDEPLAFNRIYKSIGDALGYNSLPEVWHKPEQEGLVNGALQPEGMIAGDDILGSGREEFTAFIVGKQLFLFLQPFYLGSIRPVTDLQVFLILAASLVRDDVEVDMTREMQSAHKAMRKRIKGQDLQNLKAAVKKISDRETDLNMWIEAVEDTANRVGLLFCDDLDAAEEYLKSEPEPLGTRTVDQRMHALVEYSVSEKYFQLRDQLGLRLG